MPYSLTFIGAIMQFLVVAGLLTVEESEAAKEGVVALVSLGLLAVTLYGRVRARLPVSWTGKKIGD